MPFINMNPKRYYSKQAISQPKGLTHIASEAGKMMHLQKNPFQSLGLSHSQNALIIWLYCQAAQNPHGAFALSDISSQSTLNTLMGRVLKQSYVVNYQNQLTFALSKTKSVVSTLKMTKMNHPCVSTKKGPLGHNHNPFWSKMQKQNDPALFNVKLQSFTIGTQLIPSELGQMNNHVVLNKGTEFYSANWILYNLQQKLQTRNSNIKRAMQELFEKANLLLDQKILKGLTIRISGRLSGRKQGMAKTVSKTIGVLPLSGLKQKVDYDQGFVTTKLGSLGIKVWVFY